MISVAIDTINSDINRLRGDIKRGFSTDAFDTLRWLQQVWECRGEREGKKGEEMVKGRKRE